jgi:hypothetical protein
MSEHPTNISSTVYMQIDYADDVEWNMWVKAGVWKLLSDDAKPTLCITDNNSNLFTSRSPHQFTVPTTVTPSPTSCAVQNDTYLDHESGNDLLNAMGYTSDSNGPQEPMMVPNIQVSNYEILLPGVSDKLVIVI